MAELADAHALALERSCAVTAVALSEQRREGVRLVTGDRRAFGLNEKLTFVHVPYPAPDLSKHDWTRRTLTCGVALQCSPSKERVTEYRLNELSARELRALTLVEGRVALGWIASRWPGLLSEVRRTLPELGTAAGGVHDAAGVGRQIAAQLRQDALDDNAEAAAAAVLGARRR
jgi:nitric oxide reductase NorD protein